MAFGKRRRTPPPIHDNRGTEHPPGSLEFEQKLDKISQSSVWQGNKVNILLNGPEFYPALFKDLEEATTCIYLENFIIANDKIGTKLAELLCQKSAAGVKIAVIHDAFGSMTTPQTYWHKLREAGVIVKSFHAIRALLMRHVNRDHRKTVTIDGRIAYTGGICMADAWHIGDPLERGPWRDTGVRIEGPCVTDFSKAFAETWSHTTGQPEANPTANLPVMPTTNEPHPEGIPVRVIHSDADPGDLEMYHTYLLGLTTCTKSAYLTTAYFVPDKLWLKTMSEAAKRGVDIRLLLPEHSDEQSAKMAGRYFYERLLEAGVRIYEYQPVMVHAKTAVFDDCWSLVGSCNLDYLSLLNNYELNIATTDLNFAHNLQNIFLEDLAKAKEIKLSEWVQRPTKERFKENLYVLGRPEL